MGKFSICFLKASSSWVPVITGLFSRKGLQERQCLWRCPWCPAFSCWLAGWNYRSSCPGPMQDQLKLALKRQQHFLSIPGGFLFGHFLKEPLWLCWKASLKMRVKPGRIWGQIYFSSSLTKTFRLGPWWHVPVGTNLKYQVERRRHY